MKLEITKNSEAKVFYTLEWFDNGVSVRKISLYEESYKALEEYFAPRTINSYSNEFESLWKIHSKGNKKTAMIRFSKVMRVVSFEELKRLLSLYIKSNDFIYLKGLDVWLNPDKEHWNDPIVWKDGKEPDIKETPDNMRGMVL